MKIMLAGAIGFLVFARCLGFGIVDPANLHWIFVGGVDPSQHFTGWHMFRHEAWTLPLGVVRSFGYPVGTSVALTDAIPIAAILLKPFSGILPADFQYLGLWLLGSFVLQGVFGALLVSTITRRLAIQLLGATLFVLSPLVVHSIGQAALAAQWQVVAALWLYFSDREGWRRPWVQLVLWSVLVAIAAGTHAYLSGMVLALAGAAMFRSAPQRGARRLARAAMGGVVLVAVALSVWWLTGYFVVGDTSDLRMSGFGVLSLNILAPLRPPEGSFLFGRLTVPVTEAQQPGSSYLGAGVMVLAIIGVAMIRLGGITRDSVRANLPLWIACLVLTLLALSPTITFGTRTVLEYDPGWWGPLSVFRVSTRMFWPVYYAILFGAITLVVRRLAFVTTVAVLSAVVVIQAVDFEGICRAAKPATGPIESPLRHEFWNTVPRFYRHMVLYPTNICGGAMDYRFFALHAGRVGATINGGTAARGDMSKLTEYCRGLLEEMRVGKVADDSLYILLPPLAPPLQAVAQTPLTCVIVDGFAACFTANSQRAWQDVFDVGPLLKTP